MSWRLSGLFLALAGFSALGVFMMISFWQIFLSAGHVRLFWYIRTYFAYTSFWSNSNHRLPLFTLLLYQEPAAPSRNELGGIHLGVSQKIGYIS